MGFKLVKHLEAVEYNRKLFYLDRGAADLPPITDMQTIRPGSEARSLATGEKWILNTAFKWVWVGTGDCCCTGGNGTGGNGSGSGDGDGDVPVPGEEPKIEGISLAPQNVTAAPGSTIAFMANIEGNSKLNQGITWTVKGQSSNQTKISGDGILTIAENEKNKTLTVRATSQGDSTIYAQGVVNVSATASAEEQVLSLTILPTEIEVIKGNSVLFSAKVAGVNVQNHDANFSVNGANSPSTYMDGGKLTVGADETSKLLIVRAESVVNANAFDVTTVTVVAEDQASNPMSISGVKITPDFVRLAQGYSTRLAAEVLGESNPPQDVVWEVQGASSADTRINANGLLTLGKDESVGLLTVIATSVFDPDQSAESDIQVLDASDPAVIEEMKKTTVTAVIVTPSSVEVPQNTQKIFSAVAIGNNDPSQAVTWTLKGANTQTSYVTEQGVVIVGKGETAKMLTVEAQSVADPTVVGTAYIQVGEPKLNNAGTINDVPTSPLDAAYVRVRTATGDAVWQKVDSLNGSGTGTGTTTQPDPTIHAIEITPEASTVAPGSVITFQVQVDVTGDLSSEVEWSIKGQASANTTITADGILKVADDETSKLITVKAASVLDSSKSGRATVAVDKAAPVISKVTGIVIIPGEADVLRGNTLMLQALVSGINVVNPVVSWELTGNTSKETHLASNGLLTVAPDEIAAGLVIIATCENIAASVIITVTPPEMETDPWTIESVSIVPTDTVVGIGKNTRFGAVVSGLGTPPQDVIYEVLGNADANTHMSRDGVLYCGEEAVGTVLTVLVRATYNADKTTTATVKVLAADDPAVIETTVSSVLVAPGMVESYAGGKETFTATVLGNNNPSQEVKWSISGAASKKTTISKLGVLTIASDETAKAITVQATSVADSSKVGRAYLTMTATPPSSGGETGSGLGDDVPAVPLGQDYVRRRDETGRAYWKAHDGCEGAYTLGNKLDILNVLDNGEHSALLREVELVEDFLNAERRWALHETPAGWKLVTELHTHFWNMIQHHPETYKLVVGMNRSTGKVMAYMTCFTDEREFVEPVKSFEVVNPIPLNNVLADTNFATTDGTFQAYADGQKVTYRFNTTSWSLDVIDQQIDPEGVVTGAGGSHTVALNTDHEAVCSDAGTTIYRLVGAERVPVLQIPEQQVTVFGF